MKILGIGSNYVTDLKGIEEKKKGKKFIFSKPSSSLAINCDVVYPKKITNELIYEVELVIKIGKEGKVRDAFSCGKRARVMWQEHVSKRSFKMSYPM